MTETPRCRRSGWRVCKSFSSIEQTGHQLAKKFTMTGLPTKSLDEKGWPSTVCDSKLGRGRPRSSCEIDGMSAASTPLTVRPIATVPTTIRPRQRRRRLWVFSIIAAVPPTLRKTRAERALDAAVDLVPINPTASTRTLIESFRNSLELVTLDEGHVRD